MKEESELRYETKENLAKPPLLPIRSLPWTGFLFFRCFFSSLFIVFSSSEDPKEKGSASAWLTDEPF